MGININFEIKGMKKKLKIYTTRPDTIYGVTFIIISPEHFFIKENIKIDELFAINPVTKKEIPIFVSNYVSDAKMGVPAHDVKDYEFAQKFNLPIIPVIAKVTGMKRENEFTKDSIVAIVYNPKTDKYLTINWGKLGGRNFIGGTIEGNEDIVTCAKREILEETGYKNVEFIRNCFPIKHHYFAFSKNKPYNTIATGLLFHLINEEKTELNLDESEIGKFKVEWVSNDIIEKEIVDELFVNTYINLLNPTAYFGDGIYINSDILNGITNRKEAVDKIISFMQKEDII